MKTVKCDICKKRKSIASLIRIVSISNKIFYGVYKNCFREIEIFIENKISKHDDIKKKLDEASKVVGDIGPKYLRQNH